MIALSSGCLFSGRWEGYSKEFAFQKFSRDNIVKVPAFGSKVFSHYMATNNDVKYETCSANVRCTSKELSHTERRNIKSKNDLVLMLD